MAEAMVMIGCKAPNGVVLNLDSFVRKFPGTNDPGVQRVDGKRTVTLKGWSHRVNEPDMAAGTGGYVLTPVPADFWEAWAASHTDFPMLTDGTIIAPHKDSIGQARAHAEVPKMHAQSDGELKRAAYNPKD
jgi:hypothetical protein